MKPLIWSGLGDASGIDFATGYRVPDDDRKTPCTWQPTAHEAGVGVLYMMRCHCVHVASYVIWQNAPNSNVAIAEMTLLGFPID